MQDKLKRSKKTKFIAKWTKANRKKAKRHNPSRIKKLRNKIQNLFQNEIKQIKWKINLLQYRLDQFKKRQSLLQNGLEQIAKMQNLTQNELEQITRTHNQARDELEQIAEIRRIKNYEKMSKERLIIALLKSKRSLAGFFNNIMIEYEGYKKSLIN